MTWMTTYSGRALNVLDIDPAQLRLGDLARAIAALPRFTGHTLRPYSGAEHSVNVAYQLLAATGDRGLAWDGLGHDLHEAITNDVSAPAKAAMRELAAAHHIPSVWDMFETRVERVVRAHYGLTLEMHEAVRFMDLRLLVTEHAQLMAPALHDRELPDVPAYVRPCDLRIDGLGVRAAEVRYLEAVVDLAPLDWVRDEALAALKAGRR